MIKTNNHSETESNRQKSNKNKKKTDSSRNKKILSLVEIEEPKFPGQGRQKKSIENNILIEGWRILSFMAMILIIASFMVLYSSFYPESIQSDFIWLEHEKSKLYASYEKLLRQENKDIEYISTEQSEECTKISLDVSEKAKSSYQDNLYTLRSIENQIINQKKLKNNRRIFINDREIEYYNKSFDHLLELADNYRNHEQNKFLASQEISSIFNSLTNLCNFKNMDEGKKDFLLTEVESGIKKIRDLKINPDTKIESRIRRILYLVSPQKYLSEDEQNRPLLSSENKDEVFQSELLEIQKFRTKDLVETPVFQSKELFINNFKEFENWQKSFVSNQNNLEDKVFFILS